MRCGCCTRTRRSEIPLDSIAACEPHGSETVCLSFSSGAHLYVRARAPDHFATLLAILCRICQATGPTREAIGVAQDDAYKPPTALSNTDVHLKNRLGQSPGTLRLVVGRSNLLLLRGEQLTSVVVTAVPVWGITVLADWPKKVLPASPFLPDAGCTFEITPHWKGSFKVASTMAAIRLQDSFKQLAVHPGKLKMRSQSAFRHQGFGMAAAVVGVALAAAGVASLAYCRQRLR